ncbi:predicted protein, partial [Postia placenta Mad-698-R]
MASSVLEVSQPIAHKTRQYQSHPGSHYVLPSDEPERERLNLQHRLLTTIFDNRLIFAPLPSIRGDEAFLDSGTGSGIWLLDVLNHVPSSVKLYGIDIEPCLFPRDNEALLSRGNIHFSVGSITKLPAEWTDTFTLVQQRLLVAALQHAEWRVVISEIFRVLKPTGWVQLCEAGPFKAGPVTDKFRILLYALFAHKGLLLDCGVHIPIWMREAGFTNIHVEERAVPLGQWAGQLGVDGSNDIISIFRGMKTPILNAGGLGLVSSEEEFDGFLDDLEKEWDETEESLVLFWMSGKCGECGETTAWDQELASTICTHCGTLGDPNQVLLTSHADFQESSTRDTIWNPSSGSTLKGRNGWALAGQGKEARDKKNRTVASRLAHAGSASRAQTIFDQAMNRGQYRWGRKAKLTAGASVAIALREARKSDALHDIAYLLEEHMAPISRAFSSVISLLQLGLASADPSMHFSALQGYLHSLVQDPTSSLPPKLLTTLRPLMAQLPTVMCTAKSLANLLSRSNTLSHLPTPPTACALMLLALEGELRSSIPNASALADALSKRLGV